MQTTPYSVEPDKGGCEHCGHNRLFAIVFHSGQPDEFQLSTTFGDQDHAEWIAEQLNDAFQRGSRRES